MTNLGPIRINLEAGGQAVLTDDLPVWCKVPGKRGPGAVCLRQTVRSKRPRTAPAIHFCLPE